MHMHTLYSGVKCNRPTAYTQKHTPTRFWLEVRCALSYWYDLLQILELGSHLISNKGASGPLSLMPATITKYCFSQWAFITPCRYILDHWLVKRKKMFWVISDKSEITYYPLKVQYWTLTQPPEKSHITMALEVSLSYIAKNITIVHLKNHFYHIYLTLKLVV